MKTMEQLKATGSRKHLEDSEFYLIIADLLESEEVQHLKQFRHHIMTTRFQHCLNVAYYQYRLCRLLGLDAVSAARAGLLHDFYFYDTYEYTHSRPEVRHSKHHPELALENARKHFALNEKECDMIRKHMFPMTAELPGCAETWLITLVDKYCAVLEFVLPQPKRLKDAVRNRRRARVN